MSQPNRGMRLAKVLFVTCCLLAVAAFCLRAPIAQRYRLWRAHRALQSRDPGQALDWLEAAKQADGEQADVYFLMARAHRHLEAYDIAMTHLRQAHSLGYPLDELEREKLLAMAASAQLGPNDARLQELTASSGNDTRDVFEALVKGYLRLYELGPAHLVLDTWEASFPKDPQPRIYRGLLSEHDEQWPDAARWYRRAMELAPSRRDVRMHLARTERKQHHYRQAVQHYEFALQIEADVDALHGLGKCLQALGRLPQAREAFLKGLAIAPDNFDCLLALGKLDVDAGRGADALTWLEPAVQLKPRDYDARFYLAKAFLFSGQGEQAQPHFRFAADTQLAMSRVKALMRYVADHPESAEYRYEIGSALLKNGEVSDGLRWLQSVLQYAPDHPRTHAALAEFYGQGENAEAATPRRPPAEPPR